MQTITIKVDDHVAARIKRVAGKRQLNAAAEELIARGFTVNPDAESRIPNAKTARALRAKPSKKDKVFTKPGELLAWMKTL